jgi:hypothetical protein
VTDLRDVALRSTARYNERGAGRGVTLALCLLFALAAISVSAGLVVYTAWRHDLENGLFAIAFAVLSVRAALSWCLWHNGHQLSAEPGIENQRTIR